MLNEHFRSLDSPNRIKGSWNLTSLCSCGAFSADALFLGRVTISPGDHVKQVRTISYRYGLLLLRVYSAPNYSGTMIPSTEFPIYIQGIGSLLQLVQ